MANILIVEDEKNMQSIIAEYMQRGGHICFTADDGVDALMILKNNPMDLMILDVMMPHLDGFSVCKAAREISNLPIIMLTAKSEEEDKLKGYELGADDYITKPFSPKVLLAKVGALLRRSSITPTDALNAGKISIIPASHNVFLDGQEITLTHKEYELLYFFMVNPGLPSLAPLRPMMNLENWLQASIRWLIICNKPLQNWKQQICSLKEMWSRSGSYWPNAKNWWTRFPMK